jgi:hypothetical protein
MEQGKNINVVQLLPRSYKGCVDTATPTAPEKRDQQRCTTSGGDNGGEIDMLIAGTGSCGIVFVLDWQEEW